MRARQHPAAAFAAIAIAIAACGDTDGGPPAGRVVIELDSCGHVVRFDRRPQRVVTIGPSAVYDVVAAGAGRHIVGRAGEFGARITGRAAVHVRDAPVIDPEDPSREAIVATGADVVVHNGLFKTSAGDLEEVGVRSLFTVGSCALAGSTGAGVGDTNGAGFDDVFRDVEQLGRLFGTEHVARRIVRDLEGRVRDVQASAGVGRPLTAAALYFFPGSPPAVNGNRSMAHAQMQALGLRNVFDDVDQDFVEANMEALIERDPSVIVLAYGFAGESFSEARRRLLRVPGAERLAAVRGNRVIPIPAHQRAPDVNAVAGLEALAEALARMVPAR